MSHSQANADDNIDLVAFEKEKIKGAIRTDFILSAEIVVISLGVMTASTLTTKAISLAMIALVMTVGVYGLVAMIVKMDDLGVYLLQSHQASKQVFGRFLFGLAPKLMKFLSVAGTLAMFLVGGGILVHGIVPLHHGIEHMAALMGVLSGVVSSVLSGLVGFLAGLAVLMLLVIVFKLRHAK